MRLSRVEAVRFGRLDDVALGPLEEGLNVVLGPNGAGKTSFTTLVRHVLYGYPKRSENEPGYESVSGKRLARLEFADGDGSWVVERTEGVRGGQVGVTTVSGDDRPDLVERLTQGISRSAFRVAFGFGLKDMPDIEPGAGGADGILSRLYAARLGLAVSPLDVLTGLEEEAGGIWRARGQKPEVNELSSTITDAKKRLRDLEAEATGIASERERLAGFKERCEELLDERDAAMERHREIELESERVASHEARLASLEESLREVRSDIDDLDRRLAETAPDERVLSVAPELGTLLDDVSGFKARLDERARAEAQATQGRTEAARALEQAGVDEGVARAALLGPESTAGIVRYRDSLARARARGEESARAMTRAAVQGSDAVAQTPPVTSRYAWIAYLVVAALGGLAMTAGVMLGQWLATVLGVLLVVGAGAAFAAGADARRGRERSRAVSQDDQERTQAAREAAATDAAALKALESEWRAWLAERRLDAVGDDPEAVAMLVSALEIWRRAQQSLRDAEAALRSANEQCVTFRDRLASAAGEFVPGLGGAGLSDVLPLAAQAREALRIALETRSERATLEEKSRVARKERQRLEAERDESTAAVRAILERFGVGDGGMSQLKARAEKLEQDARDIAHAYDELAGKTSHLEGALDSAGSDSKMAELRLELAGLEQRRADALARYRVLAIASGLIERARDYHERERQPLVLKRAGEIFAAITEGRYDRISVPTGSGRIVAMSGVAPTPSAELSRGTQEQLYLALRIALIEQLDEVGIGLPVLMDDVLVNFDPDRRRGAALAVGELARHRQVVFFTCHPEVVDLLAREAPDRNVVRLAHRA